MKDKTETCKTHATLLDNYLNNKPIPIDELLEVKNPCKMKGCL